MTESIIVAKHLAFNYHYKWADGTPNMDDLQPLHIHFCESGIPKDGPSAGVPITMAILSHLSKKPLLKNIASTGEVALDGSVLRIGGLREKLTAAIVNGIIDVYIPQENSADYYILPESLRNKVNPHFISNISEMINEVFNDTSNKD
jgi:ATP-dependent Lon protease